MFVAEIIGENWQATWISGMLRPLLKSKLLKSDLMTYHLQNINSDGKIVNLSQRKAYI